MLARSILLGACLCALGLPALAGELAAGTARVNISTDAPLVMVNGEVSQGVYKDIWARVLSLFDGETRIVLVTTDLNCLDVATPILRERLQRELGLPPAAFIPLATHNHNAPIQIVPDNFAYGRDLAEKIYGAIDEAIAAEAGPVRLEFGSTYGYWLMAMGNAPVDHEIQVLRVLREGAPVAVLFNQGTHPQQSTVNRIDTGHPGYAVDYVEDAWPGVQAMYADAAGGNQFVRNSREFQREFLRAKNKGVAEADAVLDSEAQALGRKLADAVRALKAEEYVEVTGPLSVEMDRFSLPLAPPMSQEEALELAKKVPADCGFVPYPDARRDSNWVRMLLHHYEAGIPFPTETGDMICTDDTYLIHKKDEALLAQYADSIHDTFPCEYEETIVARLGDLIFVAMQGEVCAPIGMRIKDAFRSETPIMVFGYMGEHNLYIPTREIVRLGGYQAKVLQIQYASPVGWSPEVEDEMVRRVLRLIRATD
jgi:hypothetical protein